MNESKTDLLKQCYTDGVLSERITKLKMPKRLELIRFKLQPSPSVPIPLLIRLSLFNILFIKFLNIQLVKTSDIHNPEISNPP